MHGRCRPRMPWRRALLLAGSWALAGSLPAAAQAARPMPGYVPLNPISTARSSLTTVEYHQRAAGWRMSGVVEYGSATELEIRSRAAYVLDAEIARFRVRAARDVGAAGFLFLEAGAASFHAGAADGFFDAFHRLIGHDHLARDSRPTNEFAYTIALGDDLRLEYPEAGPGLTDARLGLGWQFGPHAQTTLLLTLPTATLPSGYRMGVPAAAVVATLRALPLPRVSWEGSLGAGYTPRHGPMAGWQRTTMLSASAAILIRAVRDHALYGLVFYHSPVHDVALPELAGGELVTEFGVVLARRAGRDWRLGLVEDLRLSDAGMDLILKLSASF
jgi:hypothetical protein